MRPYRSRLPSSEFTGIADMLSKTSMVDGSAGIHAGSNTAITLQNVTAADRKTHTTDFALFSDSIGPHCRVAAFKP